MRHDYRSVLAAARKDAGLSYAEVSYRLRSVLPPSMWVSLETIRRVEHRTDPDPVLAAALASIYGKNGEELPTELAAELEQVSATLDELRSGSSVGRARA